MYLNGVHTSRKEDDECKQTIDFKMNGVKSRILCQKKWFHEKHMNMQRVECSMKNILSHEEQKQVPKTHRNKIIV